MATTYWYFVFEFWDEELVQSYGIALGFFLKVYVHMLQGIIMPLMRARVLLSCPFLWDRVFGKFTPCIPYRIFVSWWCKCFEGAAETGPSTYCIGII